MTFKTQGYIDLPLRISEERLKTIREELSVYANSQIQSAYGILRNNAYMEIAILRQTLDDYNLGKLACDILDIDEVILFQDNLIWKPAYTERTIEWHQDYSYWPLSAPKGITFWIAIDDTNRENGCMQYIPQSHNWGECQAANFFKDNGYFKGSEHPKMPTNSIRNQSSSHVDS